jgi:hypothetical protein
MVDHRNHLRLIALWVTQTAKSVCDPCRRYYEVDKSRDADPGHFHHDGLMLWLLATTNDGTRAGIGVDAAAVVGDDDARWPQCGVQQRAGPHQAGTESQLR